MVLQLVADLLSCRERRCVLSALLHWNLTASFITDGSELLQHPRVHSDLCSLASLHLFFMMPVLRQPVPTFIAQTLLFSAEFLLMLAQRPTKAARCLGIVMMACLVCLAPYIYAGIQRNHQSALSAAVHGLTETPLELGPDAR